MASLHTSVGAGREIRDQLLIELTKGFTFVRLCEVPVDFADPPHTLVCVNTTKGIFDVFCEGFLVNEILSSNMSLDVAKPHSAAFKWGEYGGNCMQR